MKTNVVYVRQCQIYMHSKRFGITLCLYKQPKEGWTTADYFAEDSSLLLRLKFIGCTRDLNGYGA